MLWNAEFRDFLYIRKSSVDDTPYYAFLARSLKRGLSIMMVTHWGEIQCSLGLITFKGNAKIRTSPNLIWWYLLRYRVNSILQLTWCRILEFIVLPSLNFAHTFKRFVLFLWTIAPYFQLILQPPYLRSWDPNIHAFLTFFIVFAKCLVIHKIYWKLCWYLSVAMGLFWIFLLQHYFEKRYMAYHHYFFIYEENHPNQRFIAWSWPSKSF